MKSQIYVINAGRELMFLDLETLEYEIVSRADAAQKIAMLKQNPVTENKSSYLQRCNAVQKENIIEPLIITGFQCNYNCEYCFERDSKMNHHRMMVSDIENIKQFYQEYCEKTSFPLKFGDITVMGGEPLLPGNRELLEAIAEAWPDSRLNITTNGTYLEEHMPFLLKYNVRLKVSIDGAKETHFKKRRCKEPDGVYEKMIRSVAKLVKQNQEIVVLTVFEPDNMEEYTSFFDVLEQIGWLSNPNLSMGFIPQMQDGCDDISGEYLKNSLDAFCQLKRKDKRAKFADARKLVPGSINLRESIVLSQKHLYEPYRCKCLEMPDFTFLPDGNVQVCLAVSDSAGCIGTFKPEIKIDYEKIDKFKARRIDRMKKCRKCSMKAICRGGCVATALKKTREIDGTYCELWESPIFFEYLEEVL